MTRTQGKASPKTSNQTVRKQNANNNNNNQQKKRTIAKGKFPRGRPNQANRDQIGAVIRTRLTKTGISNIYNLRVSWVLGYTFVGNGANGAANAVLFETNTSTYLISGRGVANGIATGLVPILSGDANLGATYVSDVCKHFARKVIKKMWLHIDSLQPSTANNMMCVIAPFRGGSGTYNTWAVPLATAGETGNTVTNVSSMQDAFPIDSWQSLSKDISHYIAGGSGPRQNEFDIGSTDTNSSTVLVSGASATYDGAGSVPAMLAVAGNNTTAALQNTKVHQIVVEQEIDLLDYVGGMGIIYDLD